MHWGTWHKSEIRQPTRWPWRVTEMSLEVAAECADRYAPVPTGWPTAVEIAAAMRRDAGVADPV